MRNLGLVLILAPLYMLDYSRQVQANLLGSTGQACYRPTVIQAQDFENEISSLQNLHNMKLILERFLDFCTDFGDFFEYFFRFSFEKIHCCLMAEL